MLASELIKELQKQIDENGDRDVKIWFDNECKYFRISDIYSTIGCNELIEIGVELEEFK